MRSARQNSLQAPSVRTSSSHRSTIETRGVPEFDRDYARQLSVAKRGRSGSVKPSPRAGSAQESPLEEAGIGHFQGSAAAAATRIKDYVATHVTPPRPFQSSPASRTKDDAASVNHAASTGAGSPLSTKIVGKAGTPHDRYLFGAATPSANEDGAGGSDSPPSVGSLNSTRRGSLDSVHHASAKSSSSESLVVFVLKTVLLCAVVFFVLLCAVSFVASSDREYNPTYFSLSGSSSASAQQRLAKAPPRSMLDRMIPQLNRQIALHVRRMLQQFVSALGVTKVIRFTGRMVRGVFRPVTFMWTVIKEGIVSPIVMVFPQMDFSVHPTLRYVFSASTEAAEGWSFSKTTAVLGSLSRSLIQLVVEPVFIIGRTAHAMGSGLSQSVHLFSVPLVGHNTSTAVGTASSRGNTTNATIAAAKAVHRTNRSSPMSRAAASMLLNMWRPLHRLWSVVGPLTMENSTTLSPLHQNASHSNRTASSAPHSFASLLNSSASASPADAAAPKAPKAPEVAQPVKGNVRTTHRRRISGEMWAALLEKDADTLHKLAREDLQDLLGGDAAIEDVQLRPGSLIVDFTVSAPSASVGHGESQRKLQQTAQAERDAQVAKGIFSRLQAFYDEAATKAAHDRDAASIAAATECEARVAACRHDCDALQQRLGDDVRVCEASSAEAQQACETSLNATARRADVALQECQSAEQACQTRASECAARFAEVEKLLVRREVERNESATALAAVRQALSAASAGHANESEAERQRCAVKVAKVKENCTVAVQAVRARLAEENAKDAEARGRALVAELQRTAERTCSERLAGQERGLIEQRDASLQRAESACAERLKKDVDDLNRTSAAAVKELQRTLNATATEAAERLAACEEASKQAATHWGAERKELEAGCANQLADAQRTCQETERQAAKKDCAERVAAQETEMQASCNATLRAMEAKCREQLSHDVAVYNSSAATALAQLRSTVDATQREAEQRVAACMSLRDTEREACAADQQRLTESCREQLSSARNAFEATLQEKLRAERAAQQHIAEVNWTREAAALAVQCRADTQRAVAEASASLEAQHASAVQSATEAVKQRAEVERKKAKEAVDVDRETVRQRHTEELRSCEAQVASCVSDSRATAAAHAKAVEDAREQLIAFLSNSGEEACLEQTHHDKSGCAAERRKIDSTLQALPTGAALSEVLSRLRSGGGASPSGHITWNFTGSGLRSLIVERQRGASGATPWLHVTGMVVGLASAAYALFRRQRDRRLYKDTVAQLNALITANETNRALRSPLSPRARRGRLATAACAFADDAPVSWSVAAVCLDSCMEALVSWHATCCAVLFEQEEKEMLMRRCEAQASTLSNLSLSPPDATLNDPHALSLSRGGVPTTVVSPSTLPLTDVDASRVESTLALSHMHEAFVGTYFNILEMYYVDLLNAVANRELAESQLQETEAVASRQAVILHKQSAAVAQLKQALAEKEKELAKRSSAAASVSGVGAEDKLAREERRTAAQQAMIALLEGQLKVSKEELDCARGVVQTPARTPRSEAGAESSTTKQVRSLQDLAAAENDSTNSSDFSNAGRPSPRRHTDVSPPHAHTASTTAGRHSRSVAHRGAAAEAQRSAPTSAMKKPTSMMRDPESTRRYQKLRWNDEASPQ